jgi:hypothetical protein
MRSRTGAGSRWLTGPSCRTAAAGSETAEDTGRFASHVDLYLNMLNMQLTEDALKIIGFAMELTSSRTTAGRVKAGSWLARHKQHRSRSDVEPSSGELSPAGSGTAPRARCYMTCRRMSKMTTIAITTVMVIARGTMLA